MIHKLHQNTAAGAVLQTAIGSFQLPDLDRRINATLAGGHVATAAREGHGCECFAGGVDQVGLCLALGVEEYHGAAGKLTKKYLIS